MATNNAINAPLPLGSANGGTGVANNAASTITISGSYGSTFTITGATAVTFPTSGTLATTSQLGSLPYTDETSGTVSMAIANSYGADKSTLTTFTLPSTAAVGSVVQVVGVGTGGWLIAQNASGYIQAGSAVTTTGVSGSLASTNQFDSITLICIVANNGWAATQMVGNLTVV